MNLRHISALILLTVVSLNARAADLAALRESLIQKIPGVQIGTISKIPYAGLYEVIVNGSNIIYTDEKGEFALVGDLVDLNTKVNLSQKRIEELRTVDFSQLPLNRAIVKVKGNGSRKLAVFSDPDCPFCKQLEQELKDVTDTTIYIFLFPLASLHPDAPRKAKLIWCAKDRLKAWDDLMLNSKEPAADAECETPIKEIAGLAQKLHINGTPGIVFGNGKVVSGVIPREQLEAFLSAPGRS